MKIKDKLEYLKSRIEIFICPEFKANRSYRGLEKKDANFKEPKDLIEKIIWLQLYSDTTLWSLCADKYAVRKYVEDRVGASVLNELYGKWDCVDDIDWNKLPKTFVLKTNNGCGTVIIVRDKDKMDKEKVFKKLREWMHAKYGWSNYQLHYTRIKPCIVAEKLMINQESPDTSLIDYKLWCFNGKPTFFFVPYDRTSSGFLASAFDLNWNNISDMAFNKQSEHYCGRDLAKPKSFDQMIMIAKELSKDFAEVRVDFYDINGRAVFGEMTFTTGFGYFTNEFYDYLGTKVDLSGIKKKRIANRW